MGKLLQSSPCRRRKIKCIDCKEKYRISDEDEDAPEPPEPPLPPATPGQANVKVTTEKDTNNLKNVLSI
jgi:hypothetical protein